jgi:hypothetical protein
MAIIALRSFLGEIPKLPANLLPEQAAQLSANVDHSRGYLKPLKDGSILKTVGVAGWTAGGATVRSMYTKEGVGWYTSSEQNVDYYRSPVIDEIYDRIYFITSGAFKVAEWDFSQTEGGPPASSVLAGVPTPTVAPTLELIDLTTLPDYPSATFEFNYWYESEGIRYQYATATTSTITALKKFRFTPAAMDSTTPEDANLNVAVKCMDGTKQLFNINTSYGAAVAGRTQALPGGIELTLSQATTTQYDIDLSWGVIETRAYLYTMENTYNEESAPSPATLISPTYIQKVRITTTRPLFTGYASYSDTNIYRTFGGTAGYLKIEATSVSTNVYDDGTHKASNIGTALKSAEWLVPPTSMFGLELMPQGWFTAYNGNILYMSEPYRPHTWPYSITFPEAIRGTCVGAQGLVVTTFSETYLVSGAHPGSAMQNKLTIPVGGMSQAGMCNIEGVVAFVSADGIVLADGMRASLEFSHKLFTREEWRERYSDILATMKLAYHDGFLIASSYLQDASGHYGFIVRADEATGAYTRFNKQINVMSRQPVFDALYYTTTDDGVSGRNIYYFNEGSALEYEWHSKDFIFPQSVKFGAFYLRSSGSVELEFYRDGTLIHSITATSGYYRLPPGEGLRWSVKFTSTAEVYEFVMAQTMAELRGA